MSAVPNNKADKIGNGRGNLGFEATLWTTAGKLRGNLDAAEYKHVVLGLIFLKHTSDAFEEKHAALMKDKGADAEDRDECTDENIFWVPPEARWANLQDQAKDPAIGRGGYRPFGVDCKANRRQSKQSQSDIWSKIIAS